MKDILRELKKLKPKALKYDEKEKLGKLVKILSSFLAADKITDIEKIVESSNNNIEQFFHSISDHSFFKTSTDEREAKLHMAMVEVIGFDETILSEIRR